MLLQMPLDQLVGRAQPQRPRRARGHRACIDRIEIAPGGQHVGTPARRRAARPRRHEPPGQPAFELHQFLRAARIEARRYLLAQPRHHCARLRADVGVVLKQPQRKRFQPLARIAAMAPRPIADLGKARGTRAGPWRRPVGVEGIEIRTERKVGRHRGQQTGARALPVFHRKARQRGQRIAPLPSGWRLPEDMQPVAYLRLLQFAQPCVGAIEQHLFVFAAGRRVKPEFAMQLLADDRLQDLAPQQPGATRIEAQRFVVFIDLTLQIL